MSTVTIDQTATGPIAQGVVPAALPLIGPDTDFESLLINPPGVGYEFEAHVVGNPIIEDDRITARFIIDDNVYLDFSLVGQGVAQGNKFKSGQFSLFYHIEERRPRAHFVADTLMAAMSLAGKVGLKISEPEVNTTLNIEQSLLEISKMLHRRQTAYRLMFIEEATGRQFLLPDVISQREIERIAFVYHAIIDQSFTWSGRSFNTSIPATQENAVSVAQLVQSSIWSLPVESLSETVLGQPVQLGRAIVTIEDAVVTHRDEVREQIETGDGRLVNLEIRSLSGQDKYEFVGIPYPSRVSWEPKIQALIDLEPYLDAALVTRYHALAAATLAGLSEEEKKEVTASPELVDAFTIDPDEEGR